MPTTVHCTIIAVDLPSMIMAIFNIGIKLLVFDEISFMMVGKAVLVHTAGHSSSSYPRAFMHFLLSLFTTSESALSMNFTFGKNFSPANHFTAAMMVFDPKASPVFCSSSARCTMMASVFSSSSDNGIATCSISVHHYVFEFSTLLLQKTHNTPNFPLFIYEN